MPADGTTVTGLGLTGSPAALPEPWVEWLGTIPNAFQDEVVPGGTVVFRIHNDTWHPLNLSDPTVRTINIGSLLALPGPNPPDGWNLQIRAKESTGVGVWTISADGRDLTWTLSAAVGAYSISADENLRIDLRARLNTNWLFPLGQALWAGPTEFQILAVEPEPGVASTGIVYVAEDNRLHFVSPDNRLHFVAEDNRMHYKR